MCTTVGSRVARQFLGLNEKATPIHRCLSRSVSRSALKGDYGSPFGEPSATGGGEAASTGCLSRKRFVRVRAASSLDCYSLAHIL